MMITPERLEEIKREIAATSQIDTRRELLAEVERLTELRRVTDNAEGSLMRELADVKASSRCPICGDGTQHNHSREEIRHWAQAQVNRFSDELRVIVHGEEVHFAFEQWAASLPNRSTLRGWQKAYEDGAAWQKCELEAENARLRKALISAREYLFGTPSSNALKSTIHEIEAAMREEKAPWI